MKWTTLPVLLLALSTTAVATSVSQQVSQGRLTAITHARLLDVRTGSTQPDDSLYML